MIGERLEEARKRKGVSIREAAEATKIRGDYLLAMEDNTFDIPLPQIYIRGFLKNYARYLKVDPNKVLTDYDAFQLGRSDREYATRTRADSLGHVEIPDEDESEDPKIVVTEAPEDDQPEPRVRVSLGGSASSREAPPPPTLERSATRVDQEVWNENKTLYLKIGIVFVALLMVSILLILMVRMFGGGQDTPAINPDLAGSSTSSQVAAPAPSTRPVTSAPVIQTSDSFVIAATETVTLTVDQTLDNKRLWSGTLNAGESLSIEKDGPVSIRFTNGAALVIEKNGQRMTPPQAGFGRTVVD